jgi:hypothetical protein
VAKRNVKSWYGVADLSAEETTPFAYFIALSDALRFRDQCEAETNHRFIVVWPL